MDGKSKPVKGKTSTQTRRYQGQRYQNNYSRYGQYGRNRRYNNYYGYNRNYRNYNRYNRQDSRKQRQFKAHQQALSGQEKLAIKNAKVESRLTKKAKEEYLKKAAELKNDDDFQSKLEAPTQENERMKTEDVTLTQGLEFTDMYIKKELLMGLVEKGFLHPSPIQERAIPIAMMGKDILARAKNGTGKTGAFLIPAINSVDVTADHIQVVVLVPTRELALQTSKVCKDLSKFLDLNVMVSTGGTKLRDDILRLKQKIQILIGTPGRVMDLGRRKVAKFDNCKMLIMDEADKLVSQDFKNVISTVVEMMNKERQLMLFSATFPLSVKGFCSEHMRPDFQTINMMDQLTLKGVTQFYAFVEERQKVHCLHTLLKKLRINQSIIFCNSVNRVELLAKRVTKLGYNSFFIHANLDQKLRNRVFHDFRTGKCRNLVSSDLFTRGIDIESVNVVVNFDFPKNSETYLHRIGRSGRFGTNGIAISFVTYDDRFKLFKIEQELRTEIKPIPKEVDEALYVI